MEKDYEYVNHPDHYNAPGKKECIVMMEEYFGKYWTAIFCILSAFKYKYRCGNKPNEDTERDKGKIKWYIQRAISYVDSLPLKKQNRIVDMVTFVSRDFSGGER